MIVQFLYIPTKPKGRCLIFLLILMKPNWITPPTEG